MEIVVEFIRPPSDGPGPSETPHQPLPLRQQEAIWRIKADKSASGDGFPSAQQKPWGATERSDPISPLSERNRNHSSH